MSKQTTAAPDVLRVLVLDCEALSLAVRGDRMMIGRLDFALRGGAQVITTPMTLVEAYGAKIPERRWDWALSRMTVAELGREEARQARRLLADAGLHGHKYAIDAMLAVVAMQQRGQVTVLTSDPDDLTQLLPPRIIVMKV
jgi:predicted nucleic acid-binding protein